VESGLLGDDGYAPGVAALSESDNLSGAAPARAKVTPKTGGKFQNSEAAA